MAYLSLPQTSFGASFGRTTTLRVPPGYNPRAKLALAIFLNHYNSNPSDTVSRLNFLGAGNFGDGCLTFAPNQWSPGGVGTWWDYNTRGAGSDFDFLSTCMSQIIAAWNVDPMRVYIVGYSNGGFMAHQMCWDYPTLIHACCVLSGDALTADPSTVLSSPVPTLQILCDLDATVLPGGSLTGANLPGLMATTSYLSAANSVALHATRNGLVGSTLQASYRDTGTQLVAAATGNPWQKMSGAGAGQACELTTVNGIGHTTSINSGGGPNLLYAWLEANRRTT